MTSWFCSIMTSFTRSTCPSPFSNKVNLYFVFVFFWCYFNQQYFHSPLLEKIDNLKSAPILSNQKFLDKTFLPSKTSSILDYYKFSFDFALCVIFIRNYMIRCNYILPERSPSNQIISFLHYIHVYIPLLLNDTLETEVRRNTNFLSNLR